MSHDGLASPRGRLARRMMRPRARGGAEGTMTTRHEFVDGWPVAPAAPWRDHGSRAALIGVDCDGVLASDHLLWQHLRAHYPEHIPARYEELTTFEWPRATRETAALCLRLSADPAFARRLAPIPRMAESLQLLTRAGYRIRVITARPACVRDATLQWLDMHGVANYIEELHCVDDGPAKVPLALELGCAAFVEDNHATAEALGAAGIRSYLLDAPYNRSVTRTSIRAHGWHRVLGHLVRQVPALPLPQEVPRPTAEPTRMRELAS